MTSEGPLLTCGADMKNCKLVEGKTLDDVVAYFSQREQEQERRYESLAENREKIIKLFQDYIDGVKADIHTMQITLSSPTKPATKPKEKSK
jgi:hypothetical protein